MSEFYVGQKVHCKRNGDGVVTAISDDCKDYPIKVVFADDYYETYTREGKLSENIQVTHLTSREEVMPKDFYVGQEVCCKHKGEGVVIEINEPTRTYPVKVKFHSGGYETYTADGKAHSWSPEPDLTPAQEEPVFTVGQRVWCVIFGEGVVAEITCGMYLVKVRFGNGEMESYTSKGNLLSRGNRTLFHHPVKIVQDESATKPSIDWSHVKGEYKWLSVDKDGSAYVYENEPEHSERDYWYSQEGTHYEVSGLASYTPGTCDWQDSLVKRPR